MSPTTQVGWVAGELGMARLDVSGSSADSSGASIVRSTLTEGPSVASVLSGAAVVGAAVDTAGGD